MTDWFIWIPAYLAEGMIITVVASGYVWSARAPNCHDIWGGGACLLFWPVFASFCLASAIISIWFPSLAADMRNDAPHDPWGE